MRRLTMVVLALFSAANVGVEGVDATVVTEPTSEEIADSEMDDAAQGADAEEDPDSTGQSLADSAAGEDEDDANDAPGAQGDDADLQDVPDGEQAEVGIEADTEDVMGGFFEDDDVAVTAREDVAEAFQDGAARVHDVFDAAAAGSSERTLLSRRGPSCIDAYNQCKRDRAALCRRHGYPLKYGDCMTAIKATGKKCKQQREAQEKYDKHQRQQTIDKAKQMAHRRRGVYLLHANASHAAAKAAKASADTYKELCETCSRRRGGQHRAGQRLLCKCARIYGYYQTQEGFSDIECRTRRRGR